MQSRYLLSVVLVLSSLIMPTTQDATVSGHLLCHRSAPAGEGQTLLVFVREETDGARSLYLSLWSEDTRLLRCEVSADPLVTEGYLSLCGRTGTQGQETTQRFNISTLLAPDGPCGPDNAGAPRITKRAKTFGSEGKTRRKRSWLFPGTLWCGTGSKAMGYEELGMFESADRCCREHDQCMHVIPAFTVNYGVFNSNFFTVSHCDCDRRFRECLFGVNDTISSMVGYSFFNILRIPCFELIRQRRCVKMYWWGMCKVAKKAPYAVFKNPFSYNTTRTTSKYREKPYGNESSNIKEHHVKERPPTVSVTKSPKSERRCNPRDPPRGDTFHRKKKKGKGCKRRMKTVMKSTQTPVTSMVHTTIPSTSTTASPIEMMTSLTSELKTAISNASKMNSYILNKKKLGKKKGSTEKVTVYPPQRRQLSSQLTTKPYQKTTSMTSWTPQTASLHVPTAVTTVSTITTKMHKKNRKKSGRCGARIPVRGDTFQSRRKICLDRKTSHTTAIAPSTSTSVSPNQVTMAQRPSKTSLKSETTAKLWSTATTAFPIQGELKPGLLTQTAANHHQNGKSPRQRNTNALRDKMKQKPIITDNRLVCGILKHLDRCQHKILPLEKKYGLQNMESKTVYHCDCTSRLAGQIEHFKAPSILPSLLMDFVSRYCFKLPTETKCHNRKSCAAAFSKASDLLQALKTMEEKATARAQNSGKDRKRGVSLRLYKRCLRIVDPGKRS